MYRVIYISRDNNLVLDDIFFILNQSYSKNNNNGVSGALIYSEPYFLQAIEGNEEIIQSVYERIKKDNRHVDIKTLFSGEVEQRVFDGWNMSLVSQGAYKEVVYPILKTSNLEPQELNSQDALAVLEAVTKVL